MSSKMVVVVFGPSPNSNNRFSLRLSFYLLSCFSYSNFFSLLVLSLSVSLPRSLFLTLSLSLHLSARLFLSSLVCLSGWLVWLSVCLSICRCLSMSLYVSLCLSLSLSLSLILCLSSLVVALCLLTSHIFSLLTIEQSSSIYVSLSSVSLSSPCFSKGVSPQTPKKYRRQFEHFSRKSLKTRAVFGQKPRKMPSLTS